MDHVRCAVCGAPAAVKAWDRKVCSQNCRSRMQYRRNRGLPISDREFASRPAPLGPTRECAWCHQLRPARRNAMYCCSPKCVSSLRHRLAALLPYDRTDIWYRECVRCGGDLVVWSGTRDAKTCRACPAPSHGRCRVPESTRRRVLDRDGWRCHLCGCALRRQRWSFHPKDATIDHLVPVADGGNNEDENLAACCYACNVRRGVTGAAQLRLVG